MRLSGYLLGNLLYLGRINGICSNFGRYLLNSQENIYKRDFTVFLSNALQCFFLSVNTRKHVLFALQHPTWSGWGICCFSTFSMVGQTSVESVLYTLNPASVQVIVLLLTTYTFSNHSIAKSDSAAPEFKRGNVFI